MPEIPDWRRAAADLARRVAPSSAWLDALEQTERHLFVPAWWVWQDGGYERHYGPDDPSAWLDWAYSDTSLLTRIGTVHADTADTAEPAHRPAGRPTSSSTHPSLLIQMYEHAQIREGMDVLDVGTGSGYGTALLCHRLGDRRVTSIDIDPYLTQAARERLEHAGWMPEVRTADAAGPLDGTYDRIVATVALPFVPPHWIEALRPGGRIALVLDGTRAILTADKQPDGHLAGRIARDWAGFMSLRSAEDYPPGPAPERIEELLRADGEYSYAGTYPLADVEDAWELYSNLAVSHSGIQTYWRPGDAETPAACLLWDEDGSWARAEGVRGLLPTVWVAGPINLWSKLEALKKRWLIEGGLPLYGAAATIEPDGAVRLRRGGWEATIPAMTPEPVLTPGPASS